MDSTKEQKAPASAPAATILATAILDSTRYVQYQRPRERGVLKRPPKSMAIREYGPKTRVRIQIESE